MRDSAAVRCRRPAPTWAPVSTRWAWPWTSRDHYEVEVTGTDVVVHVSGQDAAALPRDRTHLVARALLATATELGAPLEGSC